MKARLLDNAMRLNATAFSYEYSDLQVQLFNSTAIQFSTFNASALETQGIEFDMAWQTQIDGLRIRLRGRDRYDLLRGFYQRYRRKP